MAAAAGMATETATATRTAMGWVPIVVTARAATARTVMGADGLAAIVASVRDS